jgi:hypothetical protein
MSGNKVGSIATEYQITRLGAEIKAPKKDIVVAGFAGSKNSAIPVNKCYSSGMIIQVQGD